MADPEAIRLDMPVDEVMRRWPATIRVMIRHKMLCVGCAAAPFHSVSEACEEHGVAEAVFLVELKAAAE